MGSQISLRNGFTDEQVDRARRYHRPLYLALAVDLLFAGGVLSVLAFTQVGDRLYGAVDGLPWWGAAPGFAALVVCVSALVRLPLGFWRGFLRERRWGLSTQRLAGWVADVLKGTLVGAVFAGLVELALVALVRWSPSSWPLWAALALAAGVLVLSFLAPVVLEPLFNRFRPLGDAELARELHALAERAGVPVREVLVADASRRTKKVNAYVSGLGRTRRVVLYDTLLERAGAPEVRLVVAHELGHRRDRHVLKGTTLGMAGAIVAVLLVWAALGSDAGDPRNAPVVLLLGLGLQLATLAPGSALSRRWERAADRASLELTDDLPAFEAAHRELALANLSDLDPPRLVYLLLFSHPTPPERIAAARERAA
jgi:STE24 endopeptidase